MDEEQEILQSSLKESERISKDNNQGVSKDIDEEQKILQSSLKESEKISINKFFGSKNIGSTIGALANRALTQSNETFKISSVNNNLIKTIQSSVELLKNQVQKITNYFVIDRKERRKILRQREIEDFEREDEEQKGLVSSRRSRTLDDALPFFPESRFSQGLTAGMSSFGRPKGVAKFQQTFVSDAINESRKIDEASEDVEGSKSFFFGGLVPGKGDADTVNAKLTPGEFVIPKDKVEEFTPNFLSGLIKAGGGENTSKLPPSQREGSKSNRLIKNLRNKSESVNPFKVEDTNTPDFSLLTAISAIEGGDSQARVDVAQSVYNRLNEVKKDIGDGPGTTAITDYTRDSFKSDESGVFPEPTLSDILLKDKQYQPAFIDPNISDTKDPRTNVSPEFLNVSNRETAIQAMKSYYDKRGDKRSMEDIESLYDQTVIDLQDQKLNKDASAFVGGNTEFLSGEYFKEGDQYRGELGVDNTFFSKYGTGTQSETGAAISPLIKNPLRGVEPGVASELKNMADTDALGLENIANKASEVFGGREGLESLKNDIISIVTDQLLNKITSDKKDEEKVVQPTSSGSNIGDVTSNESIKKDAQSLMTPPPSPQSRAVELEPQVMGGDGGGGGNIAASAPSFKPSTPSHDELTGTESPLIFIEVISNPFLSIP